MKQNQILRLIPCWYLSPEQEAHGKIHPEEIEWSRWRRIKGFCLLWLKHSPAPPLIALFAILLGLTLYAALT